MENQQLTFIKRLLCVRRFELNLTNGAQRIQHLSQNSPKNEGVIKKFFKMQPGVHMLPTAL